MKHYETLSQAITDLNKRGFTCDFNLPEHKLAYTDQKCFKVLEVHRFEGMSSTGDNSVVYAIEAPEKGKGILVDAYGVYSDSVPPELAKMLSLKSREIAS